MKSDGKFNVKKISLRDNRVLIVLLVIVIFIAIAAQIIIRPDRKATLNVVYTGSIEGDVAYTPDTHAGYEKISGIADQYRKNGGDVLLVDAGNCLGGNEIAEMDEGSSIISIMNKAGYDAMVPGLLDTAYGIDTLSALRSQAAFPFLAANLQKSDGSNAFETYKIIHINSVRIGVIGVTDGVSTNQTELDALTVSDCTDTVKDVIGQMGDKIDAVIVLLYSANDDAAAQIAGIDGVNLVIRGGSSQEEATRMDDGTMIVSPQAHGCNVGVAEVTVNRDKVTVENTFVEPTEFDEVTSDTEVADIVANSIEQKNSLNTVQLGQIEVPESETSDAGENVSVNTEDISSEEETELTETESDIPESGADAEEQAEEENDSQAETEEVFDNNVVETATGDIIADAMRTAASGDNASVALIPDKDIHGFLPNGIVSQGDIYDLFDDDLYVVTCSMTGGDIRSVLEQGFSGYPEASGFLQVSGISFTYDTSTDLGSSLSDINVGYNGLDDARTYVVAMTSDLAGELGYLSETGSIVNTYHTVAYIVSNYIEENVQKSQPASGTQSVQEKEDTSSEDDSENEDQDAEEVNNALYSSEDIRITIY